MTRLIITSIILVLTLNLMSLGIDNGRPSMCEDGMSWKCAYVDHDLDINPEYYTITVDGDTVIDNIQCKILHRTDMDGGNECLMFGYEEDGRIYEYISSLSGFYPLLDFNLDADDWVDCYNHNGVLFDSIFHISASGYVNLRGVNRKVLTLGYIADDNLPYGGLWIEGIGTTYKYLSKLVWPSHGSFHTMIECSKNGEYLFKREDIGDITSKLLLGKPLEYIPLINHDRVWECIVREENGDIHVDYLKFGKSENILGKTYTKIIDCAGFEMDNRQLGRNLYFLSNRPKSTFGFMREDNAEVFTVIDDNAKIFTGEVDSNPANEAMIYKFNICDDDIFQGSTFHDGLLKYGTYRVTYQEALYVDDFLCRQSVLYFLPDDAPPRLGKGFDENHFIVDGIGSGYYGCLCHPELDAHFNREYAKYTTNRVFDSNGNVIYTAPEAYLDIPYQMMFSKINENDLNEGWDMSGRLLKYYSDTTSIELAIYDMNGRLCMVSAGIGNIKCDLSGLEVGLFIAVAKSNVAIISTKKIFIR